jgi:hypothetical protein
MQQQQQPDLTNSPSRNLVKRKIPESFYKPPALKTQVCSLEAIHASSNHAHTFSLPSLDSPNIKNPNLTHHHHHHNHANQVHARGSTGSLNEPSTFNSHFNKHSIMQQQGTQFNNSFTPQMHQQNNLFHNQMLQQQQQHQQQQLHAKTFSLPVTFDPNTYTNQSAASSLTTSGSNNNNIHHQGVLQPPSSAFSQNIDVPMPPGWTSEKTSSGQVYYINHLTKTTTWDDPRQIYNLPSNQNEISNEMRLKISQSIPLPHNWEEARSANGDVYFINHNNRTTCWEDPRLGKEKFFLNVFRIPECAVLRVCYKQCR